MREDLRSEFLRLLREDEVFRLAVVGLLGIMDVQSSIKQLISAVSELVKTVQRLAEGQEKLWGEVRALREDQNRLWQENNRLWEENNRRWEEAYKRFEAIETELRNLREDFNKSIMAFNRKLDALGARWSVISEEAFREGMKGIVEKILGTARVEKWTYNDTSGEVYGHPAIVDVDLVIRDGTHILVEVKSSISRGDVAEFWRVGRLYERVNGVKPRLVIISPYVDDKAAELARELGVDVYTDVT
ncbi:DUF3782 domain-containing protein [Vulcanisaeta sp. JCM 16161]|uniref:PD-(D/E)XK nuclease family protein n=1 Tax=Vulcanisaeta sp. JCM 16161 TaxID=1295372 RepID=UPI0006D07412|nr:DUF3782 domain-containing protein [Vulcanisaeta sp. JCM 16161]